MTAAVLSREQPIDQFAERSDSAKSDAAQWIRDQFQALIKDQEIVATRLNREQKHKAAFDELVEETSVPNWDGYGARQLNVHSLRLAKVLVEALPESIPMPEVAADPDGEVCFDWIRAKDRMLSVSVGRNGALTYAAKFGASSKRGVEFLTDEIPEDLFRCIKRVYSRR